MTSTPSADRGPGGTETILLVEDEESLRELATKVLRRNGYTVLEAANGRDALETMGDSGQPEVDLIITDVIMPEMGGRELSEKFLERYPGMKILYISGYADSAHHTAALITDLGRKRSTLRHRSTIFVDAGDSNPSRRCLPACWRPLSCTVSARCRPPGAGCLPVVGCPPVACYPQVVGYA